MAQSQDDSRLFTYLDDDNNRVCSSQGELAILTPCLSVTDSSSAQTSLGEDGTQGSGWSHSPIKNVETWSPERTPEIRFQEARPAVVPNKLKSLTEDAANLFTPEIFTSAVVTEEELTPGSRGHHMQFLPIRRDGVADNEEPLMNDIDVLATIKEEQEHIYKMIEQQEVLESRIMEFSVEEDRQLVYSMLRRQESLENRVNRFIFEDSEAESIKTDSPFDSVPSFVSVGSSDEGDCVIDDQQSGSCVPRNEEDCVSHSFCAQSATSTSVQIGNGEIHLEAHETVKGRNSSLGSGRTSLSTAANVVNQRKTMVRDHSAAPLKRQSFSSTPKHRKEAATAMDESSISAAISERHVGFLRQSQLFMGAGIGESPSISTGIYDPFDMAYYQDDDDNVNLPSVLLEPPVCDEDQCEFCVIL